MAYYVGRLNLKPKIAKYLEIGKVGFLNRIMYFRDIISRTSFLVLIIFIFAQLWNHIFEGGGNGIAGLGAKKMIWYLVMTESIILSMPSIQSNIDEEVKSGNIAYLLNKPFHYLLYHFAIYLGEVLLRFPITFLIGGSLAFILVGGFDFDLLVLPYLLVSLVMAFTLNFCLVISIALTALWIEDTTPFFWIYQKFMFTVGGLLIPLDVFPEFVATGAKILPFNYILQGPAKLLVGFSPATFRYVLIGQFTWVIILGAMSQMIFHKGVKKLSVHGG